MNGSVSADLVVDHLDGNPWNNKLDNLRLTTRKVNQRNRKMLKNNITGECGVGFHKTSNNSGGYNEYVRPTWVDKDGKPGHKDFNVKNFESFDNAVEFAALVREMMIEDKHTYTERHGK